METTVHVITFDDMMFKEQTKYVLISPAPMEPAEFERLCRQTAQPAARRLAARRREFPDGVGWGEVVRELVALLVAEHGFAEVGAGVRFAGPPLITTPGRATADRDERVEWLGGAISELVEINRRAAAV